MAPGVPRASALGSLGRLAGWPQVTCLVCTRQALWAEPFCSRACWTEWDHLVRLYARTGELIVWRTGPFSVERICPWCDVSFLAYGMHRIWCSDLCKSAHERARLHDKITWRVGP